ncbi:ComEA family DNA-binding protein [Actinocorallia longicatena]|uniref:Helix-hairpin-helix DNA-binding motif class 1 domain-containing protein n=1 Tax=Actinocorallia longicatena TaxID=111803 RepID=A0ABP6QJ72_9ACTN
MTTDEPYVRRSPDEPPAASLRSPPVAPSENDPVRWDDPVPADPGFGGRGPGGPGWAGGPGGSWSEAEDPWTEPAASLRAAPLPPAALPTVGAVRGARSPGRGGGASSSWEEDVEDAGPSEAGKPRRAGALPPRRALADVLERWDPGITGGRALVVVGLLAAMAAAVLLWTARPRTDPVPAAAPVSAAIGVPSTRAATPTPTSSVVVHVTGKVRRPGVVTLPSGSRVAEALAAAGGPRPGTELDTLNLARRLTDGEQITVGAPQPPAQTAPQSPGAGPGPSAPLDLNTATLEQLQELPGVGPVLAQRILDHRTQHGPFTDPSQLRDVTGIGEHRYADLKPRVRV